MSLAQRFERRLEALVGGAFARVFKGQVEPVEIATALQREAADRKNVMGVGQILCPNRYRVTLSSSDHERLAPWETQLCGALAELVQESLDENRWATIGDIEVYLALDAELHTGVFGVASRMEPAAPPRRRPYDSLSLPAVGPGSEVPPFAGERNGAARPGVAPFVAQPAPSLQDQQALQHQPSAQPQPIVGQPPAQPTSVHPVSPRVPAADARRAATRQRLPALIVDPTNERLELRQGSNVVGRGSDCDLQLLDQGISRHHLDVQYDGVRAVVYDLGSTNGTSVNGHETGRQVLRHGDVVRLGHTRLVFQSDPA